MPELQRRSCWRNNCFEPKVVYGYFPVQAEGDELIVYHVEEFDGCTCQARLRQLQPTGKPRERTAVQFPAAAGPAAAVHRRFLPRQASGQFDVLGVQLVTVGEQSHRTGRRAAAAANQYQDYLYLHGFGVESAEALAEFWHKRMRQELGFASRRRAGNRRAVPAGISRQPVQLRLPAPARTWKTGRRSCELLAPDAIGVILSENFMLVPEQSTDALVVHHPQAKYFDT